MTTFINSILFNSKFTQFLNITTTSLIPDHISHSDFFVSSFLSALTLFSLVLTFGKKGTAIHKVLGLLLTSIFTVFLWMFKTQLLFIYIVYILAFISAVLMLFLSVVMMLPISSISQPTQRTSNAGVVLLFSFGDELDALILALTSSILLFALLNILRCLNPPQVTKKSIALDPKLVVARVLPLIYVVFIRNLLRKGNSFVRQKVDEYISYNSHLKDLANSSEPTTLKKQFRLHYLASREMLRLTGLVINHSIAQYLTVVIHICPVVFKFSSVFKMYKKELLDVLQQTYMLIAIFLPFALTILTPQHTTYEIDLPTFKTVQGIGDIKELLYGDFSLFLIFSTVVLLVALLGAAVMTRKEKH